MSTQSSFFFGLPLLLNAAIFFPPDKTPELPLSGAAPPINFDKSRGGI